MALDTSINHLFNDAKSKDEFNYICTLINYVGMGHVNTITNLNEWFDSIEYYKSLYQNESHIHKKLRIGLLIYSMFFESNDLYKILGNLARNILGYRSAPYLYWKHEKADRWFGTSEKISKVTSILSEVGCQDITDFFQNVHHKEIRNSFFHSAYSMNEDDYCFKDGVTIPIQNIEQSRVSIKDFMIPKVEEVIHFFDIFKSVYHSHVQSYSSNKTIKGMFPVEMEIEVLGSADGLLGFTTNGSWIKIQGDMWMAMNVIFDRPDEMTRFVNDEIIRLCNQKIVSSKDGSLKYLSEVVAERNIATEKQDVGTIFQKCGDKYYQKAVKETSDQKALALYELSLSFYQRMLNIDDT